MFAEIVQAIKAAPTVIIHRHQRPDPDALGSQVGLKTVITATYPDKKVYAVGTDEPSLDQFGLMDKIDDAVYEEALVIVTDTANTDRVDDKRYNTGGLGLIKIDHHPNNEAYGDWLAVDTSVSSTSELLAAIVLSTDNELVMTDYAARCFFLGIVGDTGRFLFDNTSAQTMAIAAKLRCFDFPATQLMQAANTLSLAQARLQAAVLADMVISGDGYVNSVKITQAKMIELGLSAAETYSVVQLLGTIEGVLTWVIFVEQPDGVFRCRIRSKGPVINTIAERHHGGGHPKASGANAYSEAEMAEILAELAVVARQFAQENM